MYQTNYYPAYKRNTELYHHGVLGMKWGKRNGPPYPLSPGAHSASEKKAGYQKSIMKDSNNGQIKKSSQKSGSSTPKSTGEVQKKKTNESVLKYHEILKRSNEERFSHDDPYDKKLLKKHDKIERDAGKTFMDNYFKENNLKEISVNDLFEIMNIDGTALPTRTATNMLINQLDKKGSGYKVDAANRTIKKR